MTLAIELESESSTKIVLVDDDSLVLRVHAEMLKTLGYVPFTFESAEDALDYLREYRDHVSMVISDYRMSQMNGLEFIGKLRHFDSSLPVMILTAFAHEVDEEMAERCNVKVVDKPVRMHALLEHVQSTLLDRQGVLSTSIA